MDFDKKPYISIIVPVYNAEQYIHCCIKSICKQEWRDFEVIIVDDGSSDNSGLICDQLALQDSRITVIHQTNQGSVRARSVGVKYAKGKYIGFVDSDDWISPIMLQRMCEMARENQADIVVCDVVRVKKDGTENWTQIFDGKIYSREELFNQICPKMMYSGQYYEFGFLPCVWNKIIKKELVEKWVYSVDEKITVGDDASFIYFCILYSQRLVYLKNEFLYFYRDTENSLMKKSYVNQVDKILLLLNYFEEQIVKYDIDGLIRKQFDYYVVLMVSNIMYELYGRKYYSHKTKKKKINQIRESKAVLCTAYKVRDLQIPMAEKGIIGYINTPNVFTWLCMIGSIGYNVVRKKRGKI